MSVPPHIFILGNVPHDWLFDNERVSAVVHHGGAGTTAIGLAKGRPTVIVPFFGDQGFWGKFYSRSAQLTTNVCEGSMIHKAGAGPEPIPHKQLTVAKLTDAITFAISPSAKTAAREMAGRIRSEVGSYLLLGSHLRLTSMFIQDGVRQGVDSFYKHLPLLYMRCDLDPSRVAVWWSTEHVRGMVLSSIVCITKCLSTQCMKLSAFAAQVLADAKELDMDRLELHRAPQPSPFNQQSLIRTNRKQGI